MGQIGGGLIELDLAGRTFAPTADADVATSVGGFETDVQMNGNGTARIILTRTPSGLDGVVIGIDQSAGDLDFIQDLADNAAFFPVAATYADGEVRQGEMSIQGKIEHSSQNATASFALMGGGKFNLQ